MPLDYTVAVFDLDNCLMDARAVGSLFEPAFEAVRQANQRALSPEALEQALHACWFTAFDLVAQRHHFTPAMRAAGWQQFSQMEAKAPLRGYADIELLPRIPLRRYLVTSGFRRLQDSKIDALGHWEYARGSNRCSSTRLTHHPPVPGTASRPSLNRS